MSTLYKITGTNDRTFSDTQWGEGVTHTASGKGDLYTAGWIHACADPLVAVVMAPAYGYRGAIHLWEAEGEVGKSAPDGKVGTTSLTTVRQIAVPEVTTPQLVRLAILCAWQVCDNVEWRHWAERWLDGTDRTARAAAWAARAPRAAAWAAAEEAAWAAAEEEEEATWARAEVAEAAVVAAKATPLDLPALVRRAIAEEPTEDKR